MVLLAKILTLRLDVNKPVVRQLADVRFLDLRLKSFDQAQMPHSARHLCMSGLGMSLCVGRDHSIRGQTLIVGMKEITILHTCFTAAESAHQERPGSDVEAMIIKASVPWLSEISPSPSYSHNLCNDTTAAPSGHAVRKALWMAQGQPVWLSPLGDIRSFGYVNQTYPNEVEICTDMDLHST